MKKYIIKYTFEFLVIVMGISVSFWLNNWNENIKKINLEKKFIASVKEDLKQDKEFINQDKGLILRLRNIRNNASWRRLRAKKSRLMSIKVIEQLNNEIIKLED